MSPLQFGLIDVYNRVALWNTIAGNDYRSVDAEMIRNQKARVREEIGELRSSLYDGMLDDDILVGVIDDLADIFVTSAFLEYMKTGLCPIYEIESFPYITDVFRLANDITPENALMKVCANFTFVDIVQAVDIVMDSNFTKFVSSLDQQTITDSVKKLAHENPGDKIYTVVSGGLVVFKRASDNKILKPTTYKPPMDLSSCIRHDRSVVIMREEF